MGMAKSRCCLAMSSSASGFGTSIVVHDESCEGGRSRRAKKKRRNAREGETRKRRNFRERDLKFGCSRRTIDSKQRDLGFVLSRWFSRKKEEESGVKMSGPDVLFPLRNNFYLGAFQAAINESSNVRNLSEAEAIERDCLVYRSYVALGQCQLVIDEVNDSAPTAVQAVKLLAFYQSGGENKEQALASLTDWLSDSAIASNPMLLLVAGIIYAHEQNYNEALKHTHVGGTLDLGALNVQIYLKMYRTDHAEKQLKIMQQIDEDHTLTQLANAWVNLAVGGAKVQEAYYIFQELGEKYTWTVLLMNGSAVCQMHMGHFEEAESCLLEALNKDSKDANTLANLIVCSLHMGKPTVRHMSQLKISQPNHVLMERAINDEAAFERALQTVA